MFTMSHEKQLEPRKQLVLRAAMTASPNARIGPDVRSKCIRRDWDENFRENRECVNGLNIEFSIEDDDDDEADDDDETNLVMGQIGECEKWNFFRNFKDALCPCLNQRPSCLKNVKRFWFTNCKVRFVGELADGKAIDISKTYGDGVHYYLGKTEYAWLDITCKVHYGDDDGDRHDDDDDYMPSEHDVTEKRNRNRVRSKSKKKRSR
eukprot:477128_1